MLPDRSLVEELMEKVLERLRTDEALSAEVKEFRISEPIEPVEFPLIYVELSPASGEQLIPRGASTFERRVALDVCVMDKHLEPEKADISVLRLVERALLRLSSDPRLGGLVEDSYVERITPEYGALKDHAISRARITFSCKVMWRARP